jgi:hypothetical protein
MKSSFHSLIPFLPSLLNHSTAISRDSLSSSVQFLLCSQAHIPAGWRLETQLTQTIFFVLFITPRHGRHRKQSSYIVAWIRLRGNVLTPSLHSNGCTRHISYCDNSAIVACGNYLATAVFLAPQFLLWANTPQYFEIRKRGYRRTVALVNVRVKVLFNQKRHRSTDTWKFCRLLNHLVTHVTWNPASDKWWTNLGSMEPWRRSERNWITATYDSSEIWRLTAMPIKSIISRHVTPYSLAAVYLRLWGRYSLHHLGERVSHTNKPARE